MSTECGFARNLTDGIIRARVRESQSDPKLITPGKVYEYNIDMWSTANLFKAGHRIRLEVSSSNFPRFDRNPNTGHDLVRRRRDCSPRCKPFCTTAATLRI